MKRSQLKRRTRLEQGAPLRRKTRIGRSARLRADSSPSTPDPAREQIRRLEAARRAEFKTVESGRCSVCGAEGLVRRHHVVTENHICREGGDPWDLRWGMWVGAFDFVCECHTSHHRAKRRGSTELWRIPLNLVPDAAIEAAHELLGMNPAVLYFARFYGPAPLQEGTA